MNDKNGGVGRGVEVWRIRLGVMEVNRGASADDRRLSFPLK